jgi:hypothetical protein
MKLQNAHRGVNKILKIMDEENKIGKVQAKIVATQELINIEKDQTKKNELMHKLQILNFRKDMEDSSEKIKSSLKSHNKC